MNSSGKRHEVGAVRRGLGARAARLVGIAGDVADGRIELRERDREAVGGTGVHGDRSSASDGRRQSPPMQAQMSPMRSASASSQISPARSAATARPPPSPCP